MTRLNSQTYYQMLCRASAMLTRRRDAIDRLNVFPVPDGDTGTNMSMTMAGIVRTPPADGARLDEYARVASGVMMRGARGNSGVILSLFFRGMACGFADCETADGSALIRALRCGSEEARKAVLHPKEGTILTVMRECCPEGDGDAEALLREALEKAKESLKRTPELLPALKKARVVDSGGYGFVSVLEGMLAALTEEEKPAEAPAETEMPAEAMPEADFSRTESGDIRFGFCTECIVIPSAQPDDASVQTLREFLDGIGDSVVLSCTEELIKVHVHSNEPLRVLETLSKLGALQNAKIENMRMQQQHLAGEQASAVPAAQEEEAAAEEEAERTLNGVLAVSGGSGFSALFTRLGAHCADGGRSMNPSAQELLEVIRRMRCENVVVLPNHPNVMMAARQAAQLAREENPELHIEIVATTTLPQGIAAMLAFNEELSLADNAEAMADAAGEVMTFSLARAAKNAESDGVSVKRRQWIGLVNNRVRYADDTLENCLFSLAAEMRGREIITVYYGQGVKKADADRVAGILRDALGDDCEVGLESGQQQLYPYIISAE